MPTVVSLFSGVGGFDLGLERAGFTVVAQVENDPFCQRVLERRWPSVGRWSDVRDAYAGRTWPHEGLDLLVGGFPCQDLSVAGKRAGLSGVRSNLFYEYVRIAKALAPTFGLVENVPGLVSSHRGRDFWCVLQGLRECWPILGWRVLDSQHFGVPQRRRRVFLVGGPTEKSVAEVLALTEGGGGDSAPGGEAETDIAASLTGGSHRPGVNDPGRRKEDDVNLVVANGLTTRYGKGTDSDATDTLITGPLGGGNDGIGRRSEDDPNLVVAATLNSGGNDGGFRTEPGEHLVHALTGEGHDAIEDGTGRGPGGVATHSAIRRLTPLECERLQGFPDGWTCLCTSLELYAADPDAAALACRCPDSPRYRALGNAVTVAVIHWIGRRLLAAMTS